LARWVLLVRLERMAQLVLRVRLAPPARKA